MVVVLRDTGGIAVAATSSVELADKFQPGKYVQGAVNGHQPNTGVVLTHLLVDGSRGEVVLAGGNGSYHRPSLGGELVAVTP